MQAARGQIAADNAPACAPYSPAGVAAGKLAREINIHEATLRN